MGLFTEPQAQFYAAELLLALEHLHSHNIVSSTAHCHVAFAKLTMALGFRRTRFIGT